MKHGLYAIDSPSARRAHAREFRRWLLTRDEAERSGIKLTLRNWNNGRPVIRVVAPTVKRIET